MLKKVPLFICLLLFGLKAFSQIYDPVTWAFKSEKTGENSYDLVFTATIEEHSHIYAMDIAPGGPIATSFKFDTTGGYRLEGNTTEVTKAVEKLDEAFGFKIKTFSGKAEFRQKIIALKPSFEVKGLVNFMACNNVTCSPPKDVDFSINVTGSSAGAKMTSQTPSKPIAPVNQPVRGLLKFFLISLLAGFAGVLTPCVFPMIPMTVAFFSRGAENRNKAVIKALIFGISIILIYSALGAIVSLTSAGAGFASTISTHWIPNLLFFFKPSHPE